MVPRMTREITEIKLKNNFLKYEVISFYKKSFSHRKMYTQNKYFIMARHSRDCRDKMYK